MGFNNCFFKTFGILYFFNIDLTKEKPLECIPFDGIASTMSPDLTLFLFNIFF